MALPPESNAPSQLPQGLLEGAAQASVIKDGSVQIQGTLPDKALDSAVGQSPALADLLRGMVEKGASDLHLTVGAMAQMRIDGTFVACSSKPLTFEHIATMLQSVLQPEQWQHLQHHHELDCALSIPQLCRFRFNGFYQRGAVAAVLRQIPFRVRSAEDLGLPPAVVELTRRPRGLVLITGPTGSGKSTTLAALIDKINSERRGHIVTIEDPIEFLHQHKNCLVNQRQLGDDTQSFSSALKHVLRQDPDVVLIGELRDLETIEAALTISETGHLVFATLHTNSAAQTIHRLIDVFSPHQQAQVRQQLSMCLEGIVSQQLVPRKDKGRVLALELLIPTPAVRNLIREDKIHQIYSAMQTGRGRFGMQTLNQSLHDWIAKQIISIEEALSFSSDPDELRAMVQGSFANKTRA